METAIRYVDKQQSASAKEKDLWQTEDDLHLQVDDNSLLNLLNTSDSEKCACGSSGISMGEYSKQWTNASATSRQVAAGKDKERAEKDWLTIGVIHDELFNYWCDVWWAGQINCNSYGLLSDMWWMILIFVIVMLSVDVHLLIYFVLLKLQILF